MGRMTRTNEKGYDVAHGLQESDMSSSILITGASSGIGKALAFELGKKRLFTRFDSALGGCFGADPKGYCIRP